MNCFFASGDAPFFYPEQIQDLSWWPRIFDSARGFGESRLPILWLEYPFHLFVKIMSLLGIPWGITEKVIWIFAFTLGFVGMYRLVRYFRGKPWLAIMSAVIYMTNTYLLMLFGGGLIGFILAYSFVPLFLTHFFRLINDSDGNRERISIVKKIIISGLYIGLMVCFDVRVMYMMTGIVLLYGCFQSLQQRSWSPLGRLIFFFTASGIAALSFHLYWLLPAIVSLVQGAGLSQELTSSGMLRFLSVADFSHALSLLHPNWPENLFGKVYFLQPEFLVLPILAFGSLLFYKRKESNESYESQGSHVVFFSLLALVGVFLAKGATDPFGGIFVWLFDHVPGFILFRDPTKFYLYIALGYSVLIPYTLSESLKKISFKFHVSSSKFLYGVIYVLFLCYWCFTLRPLFTGQLTGNFSPQKIPNEYIQLKDFLVAEDQPSRTLWIPRPGLFAYSFKDHPVLSGDTFFHNASPSGVMTHIINVNFVQNIGQAGVRYVVIPTDIEKRIFLTDYQFDPTIRDQFIKALTDAGLKRITGYDDIAVFENPKFSFQIEIPEFVQYQEQWSRVGAIASLISVVSCILIVYYLKMMYGK
jgi:hypothetical protein